jgi:prophage antirepressor-like protein
MALVKKNFNFSDIDVEVLSVTLDEVVWLMANPFASALGYFNKRNAITNKVSDFNQRTYKEMKSPRFEASDASLQAKTKFINEAGLYELIMKSKMPIAKDFQKWVCSTLLPTLRKEGQYHLADASDAKQSLFNKQNQLFEHGETAKWYEESLKLKAENVEIRESRSKLQCENEEHRESCTKLQRELVALTNTHHGQTKENEEMQIKIQALEAGCIIKQHRLDDLVQNNNGLNARINMLILERDEMQLTLRTLESNVDDNIAKIGNLIQINNELKIAITSETQKLDTMVLKQSRTQEKLAQSENTMKKVEPLVVARPNDKQKFHQLKIFHRTEGDLHVYIAVRAHRRSMKRQSNSIVGDCIYCDDNANAINAFNRVKDIVVGKIEYRKIICKLTPPKFIETMTQMPSIFYRQTRLNFEPINSIITVAYSLVFRFIYSL